MKVQAKGFDGEGMPALEFNSIKEAVEWGEQYLTAWMEDGDVTQHTGIPGKCGVLRVQNSLGEDTDASMRWWVVQE